MGSKHMRNNGEEIKIHQHDNYQMAGTFKNMGDTNQNQPMKGYDHMQPGKISGGAAQYIKDSYSAAKMKRGPLKPTDPSDPSNPNEKLISSTSTKKGDWISGTNTTTTRTYGSNSGSSGGNSNKSYAQFEKEGGDVEAAKAFNLGKSSTRTEKRNYSTSGVSSSSAAPTAPVLTTSIKPPSPPPTTPPIERTEKERKKYNRKVRKSNKKRNKPYKTGRGKASSSHSGRYGCGSNC